MEELFKNEYCNAIKQRTIVYYGNWNPTNEVNLGDYGLMHGNKFVKIGNLQDVGIDFSVGSKYEVSSKNIFSEDFVDFVIEDATLNVNDFKRASLEIDLENAGNFFLNLSGCKLKYILDKENLKFPIINAINRFQLEWEYVYITDVFECEKLFLSISNGQKSYLKINTAIPKEKKIKLSDPNQKWVIKEKNNIGYLINNQKKTTPLFGICGFNNNWKIKREFAPVMIKNSRFLTSFLMTMKKLSEYSVNNLYDLDNIEKLGQKYKREVVKYTHFDYLRYDLRNGITFRYDYPYNYNNKLEPVYDSEIIILPQLLNKNARRIKEMLYQSKETKNEYISLTLTYDENSSFTQIL